MTLWKIRVKSDLDSFSCCFARQTFWYTYFVKICVNNHICQTIWGWEKEYIFPIIQYAGFGSRLWRIRTNLLRNWFRFACATFFFTIIMMIIIYLFGGLLVYFHLTRTFFDFYCWDIQVKFSNFHNFDYISCRAFLTFKYDTTTNTVGNIYQTILYWKTINAQLHFV